MGIRKIGLVTILWGLIGFTEPGLYGQGSIKGPAHPEPHKIFREAIEEIRSGSAVPPRLPSYLPYLDAENPIYLNNKTIEPSGYDLELGLDKDCEGQHVCSYGSFRGSKQRIDPTEEKPVRVLLRGGIRGWFYESQCGAYCGDAYIVWSQDGFWYAIGMKGERRSVLLRLANSAATARTR